MAFKIILALALVFVLAEAQRPFYAGLRPIGYPEVESNAISNRFGERDDLPFLGRGDADLANRFNQLPQDRQPYWYVNREAYKNFRNQPQTWELRPNSFLNSK